MSINVNTQMSAPKDIINDDVYKVLLQWTALICERIKSEWSGRNNISEWEKDIDFYMSPVVGNIVSSHLTAGGLGAWIAEYGSGSLMDKDNPYYEDYINSENFNKLRNNNDNAFTGRNADETVYSPDGTSYISSGRAKGLNLESGSKFKEPYVPTPPMHIIKQEIENAMPEIIESVQATARMAIVTYLTGGIK